MKATKITGILLFWLFAISQISFSQNTPPPAGNSNVKPKKGIEIIVNPDWEQIAEDLEEANAIGWSELEALQNKYDPNYTPEEEDIPQEILDMLASYEYLNRVDKYLEDLKTWNDANAQSDVTNSGQDQIDNEQLARDLEMANAAGQAELDALMDKYDPDKAPKEDPVPQEIIDMLEAYENLLKATKEIESIQENSLQVTAKGTGQTTGHIANLSVKNKAKESVYVLPEMFYIPSQGKYQSYVGRIPEGYTVPPGATVTIPVTGYCADVHKPPVPSGESMPPLEDWIPVARDPIDPSILIGQPSVPEPMNPPGAQGAPSVPEPMNPPGAQGVPSVPEPMNPPGQNAPPTEGIPVKILPKDPVDAFTPAMIPEIVITPKESTDTDIIITYPGTDTSIDGIIDPKEDPSIFGAILVEAIRNIEKGYDVIKETGIYNTPFSSDLPRERDAVIQQTFWMYTAPISGETYTKEVFGGKIYDQFEDATGTSATALPEEQKEEIDSGIVDFWNTFQATGVEAKVISAESPDLINPEMVLATVSTPSCRCNNITYDLEVKKGGVVVHTDTHTTPRSPRVSIAGFNYGDALEVKISNIRANCGCSGAACNFFPATSTNSNSPGYTTTDRTRPGEVDIEMDNDAAGEIGSKGNNNCQNKDKTWNAEGTEYTFTLETRDENTNERSVFQRLRIKSYCELDDCRRTLCAKIIQLNFVTAR